MDNTEPMRIQVADETKNLLKSAEEMWKLAFERKPPQDYNLEMESLMGISAWFIANYTILKPSEVPQRADFGSKLFEEFLRVARATIEPTMKEGGHVRFFIPTVTAAEPAEANT